MQVTKRLANNTVDDSESLVKRYTVLIADNHPVVREGLATLINRRSDMRVVAEAADGREAVEKFVIHSPDVGLPALKLPVMDGVETLMSICEKVKGARLIIFTSCKGEEDIYRAIRAGAFGYVLKDAPLHEVMDASITCCREKDGFHPQSQRCWENGSLPED